ncbi:MAG: ATP-binding cassette domain-containing protein [Bacteroidota bacterium]
MKAPSVLAAHSPILRIEEVRKAYGEKVAVDSVSFTMPPDAIMGLLGPNGAGKTSLIRMITTITRPDSGQIYFEGAPLSGYHPTQIGYLPEERGLYKKMYVGEQLLYLARLKGMAKDKAESEGRKWLAKFELESQWNKKVEELSKGMQQQVQFIATVIHQPRLLILDEPFSGLDPVNATRMRKEILRLHDEGTGIIFSTHRMEQVEELCEYIVLMNKGAKILEGKVKDIRGTYRENRFNLVYEGDLPTDMTSRYQISHLADGSLDIQLSPEADSNLLLRYLLDHHIHVQAFQEILPSLNDIFIKEVGVDPSIISAEQEELDAAEKNKGKRKKSGGFTFFGNS